MNIIQSPWIGWFLTNVVCPIIRVSSVPSYAIEARLFIANPKICLSTCAGGILPLFFCRKSDAPASLR